MNYIKVIFFSLVTSWIFAQNGIIQGSITDAINNDPIPFAEVVVLSTNKIESDSISESGNFVKGTVSDEDGTYRIEGIEPGYYNIRVTFLGYSPTTIFEVQVLNSRPAEINFELQSSSLDLQEVVVTVSPFKKTEESPVSLHNIGITEIRRNPGAAQDISKVVQNLPGVTSPPGFRNDLIIRGGGPNENRFYLDDVEVPVINHFTTQGASGGPAGIINVDFIREVDFFSGAFPANRGNTLSSVFNFKMRNGRSDHFGGSFTVGSSNAGISLEGPIGEKASYILSARQSYLQFLFAALDQPFLPSYTDYQAKVNVKFNQKNELYFLGLGAVDRFKLNEDIRSMDERKRYLLELLPVSPQWNYTNGLVFKHFQDNGFWTLVVSRNMLNNESRKYYQNEDSNPDNLIFDYRSQEIENKFRVENTSQFGKMKSNFGISYELIKYNNRTFSRIFTNSGPETIDYFSNLSFSKYAFFGQVSRKWLSERLVASLGFRMDATTYSDETNSLLDQFSPRFSLAYSFSDRWAFNFNAGRYFQLPPYTLMGYQEDGELLNRNNEITYIRADHLVGGMEYNTPFDGILTIEGYYKKYRNYPFLLRDQLTLANIGGDFGVIGNEPAVSSAVGENSGLEFLYQQRLYQGIYGLVSYTLGWSRFSDESGNLVPSSWDARHIVNLTFGKRFKKNWELGINWRYQSGLPYTPYAETSSLVENWIVNNGAIRDYSLLNTLRNEDSNQLDIRIDKKWFFDKWSLNLYLDIENLFGDAIMSQDMVLDRPLDDEGIPIGTGEIINPMDPISEQRFRTKLLETNAGFPLPSLGIIVEF